MMIINISKNGNAVDDANTRARRKIGWLTILLIIIISMAPN